MRLADIASTVGKFVDLDEGRGQVIGTAGWSPCYSRIRLPDGSITCRQTAHILPMLSSTRSTAMPAATKSRSKSDPPGPPATPEEDDVVIDVDPPDIGPDIEVHAEPADTPKAPKPPAKRSKLATAMDGTDAELGAFLLGSQTIPDSAWQKRAGGKSRLPKESRTAFIERALLGAEPEVVS